MIPAIWRTEAERATTPGTPERGAAMRLATQQSSAALGVIGAVGALGGFLIPLAFASPWVDNPLTATQGAFLVFAGFYVVCALVTYAVYLRRTGAGHEPGPRRDLMTRRRTAPTARCSAA